MSYAPPYGSARDTVNVAGLAAQNTIRGISPVWFAEDVGNLNDNVVLLDVRTEEEFAQGTIEGSRNIPIDELRGRMGEIPNDKEVYIFCQVGLRGHVAARMLKQHGFKVKRKPMSLRLICLSKKSMGISGVWKLERGNSFILMHVLKRV